MSLTLVMPSLFLVTLADLSTVCSTLSRSDSTSFFPTTDLHGYSVGCWKNDMSGQSRLKKKKILEYTTKVKAFDGNNNKICILYQLSE